MARSNRHGLARGGEAYRTRIEDVRNRRMRGRKARARKRARRVVRRRRGRRGQPLSRQTSAQVSQFVKSQKGLLRYAKSHGLKGLAKKCAKTLGTIHRVRGKR